MDKEIESINSRIHRYHHKRRETRSVDRNHHHSAKNSFRRENNILIPSPVRNHWRRTGVDECWHAVGRPRVKHLFTKIIPI
jgi:hypothetical protein